MEGLDKSAENELDPDRPLPAKIGFAESTDDGTQDGATNRGENNECDCVLLVVGFPHVCDHSECDRSTCGGYATKSSAYQDCGEVRGKSYGQLPDIDKQQTELQNRPSSKFLTPWCPEFATKGVKDQENHCTTSCCLCANIEFLRYTGDRVRV